MAKKERVILIESPKLFSYQMPKKMANAILSEYPKGKVDIQKVLIKWVDDNCGLMYPCNKVVIN